MPTALPRIAYAAARTATALLLSIACDAALAQQACSADLAKFCPQARAGDGQVAGCLETNQANLSPPCKEHVARLSELLKEADRACADDIHTYCSGVRPGGGRIAACLKQNVPSLSFHCKVKLAEVRSAK
jgi:hypothetical protein